MTNVRRFLGDEGGAVLVHVAVALLALMAFSSLAVDYGAFWVSRRQAQNAADAAALAGALSLAFDDPDDIPRAQATAAAAGVANQVWGAAPSIVPATDVQFIPCPPGAPGVPDTCIRADVYRSVSRSNPLPTFFAQIMGVTSQDVRATATAQVTTGNAVECLKPWSVADKWDQNWEGNGPDNGPWTTAALFDKYKKQGNLMLPDPKVITPDVYTPPSANDPGTGFRPFDSNGNETSDYGLQLHLKLGSSGANLSSGWFLNLELPNPACGGGGDCTRENIKGCSSGLVGIGDTLTVATDQGTKQGPNTQGVLGGGPGGLGLKEQDPGAVWNDSTKRVEGSCAPGICADLKYHARSPRIVPVPLFNIDAFFAGSPNGKTTINVTNIMGFFIEGMGGQGNKDVVGRLVAIPGVTRVGGNVDESASFLRRVLLVE